MPAPLPPPIALHRRRLPRAGDLGWVAPSGVPGSRCGGHLVLSGRAKDTIVLSSGKNVEPQPIEDAVAASPLIKHVVLVGQVRVHRNSRIMRTAGHGVGGEGR
jgi:long-subunit acyl-CoA synthetase (AMP-forming)